MKHIVEIETNIALRNIDEINEWLEENNIVRLTAKPTVYGFVFFFEEESDAMAFKLRWI